MTPYHQLVSDYARLLKEGRSFPLGTFKPAPRPELAPNAPKVLFFSPHPDDECISGGIALRLLREARVNVLNVAVTLGRKEERKAPRYAELKNACHYLGFELVSTGPNGLERVTTQTREQEKAHWAVGVQVIRDIIEQHQPKIICFPHDQDWNSAHIGTHFLVMDALREMPANFQCSLVETEFWGAMTDPNLLVEISNEDLADMMAATTFHVGEVARNPYHLLLPAWMMDNVRRGAEIVGGQGGAAPSFTFAAVYRLRKWSNGQATRCFEGGKSVPCSTNVGDVFS